MCSCCACMQASTVGQEAAASNVQELILQGCCCPLCAARGVCLCSLLPSWMPNFQAVYCGCLLQADVHCISIRCLQPQIAKYTSKSVIAHTKAHLSLQAQQSWLPPELAV